MDAASLRLAQQTAARCIRELARDIDDLNRRIADLDYEIAELLAEHGNPLKDLHGVGTNLAATIVAQAGDARRFRDAGAFARFCGAAPIPCGSGQTTGRHHLHRGGNRQLNAALYRIAIVQQRHHPDAKTYLARKIAEGKTPREARRALKRHLATVLYRQLTAWADKTPAMNNSREDLRGDLMRARRPGLIGHLHGPGNAAQNATTSPVAPASRAKRNSPDRVSTVAAATFAACASRPTQLRTCATSAPP